MLIKTLFKKFKKKIIITGGRTQIDSFNKIIQKNFKKIDAYKYLSIKYKNNLLLFNKISFENLENLVKKSYIVFCCEGAISHVSHAFNKKTFALIDNDFVGKFWTDHMDKIRLLKRSNIKNICHNIMKL